MKQRIPISLLAAAFVAMIAAPTLATDCTQAGNLVPNCGFVTDLSFWYFTADSTTHIPEAGASSPGAAELDRYDAIGAIEAFTACFAVSPSTEYAIGASYRLPSGTGVYGCSLDVLRYSDGNCAVFSSQSNYSFAPVLHWREVVRSLTTGSAINSAQLRLACFSSSEFLIRIDDFIFGQGIVMSPIFSDGFEWGNTQAWSTATP